MTEVLQYLEPMLRIPLRLALFICWLLIAVNAILMIRRRKSGVPLMRSMLGSPANIIFRPEDLTEDGLRARRRTIWACVGLVASIALSIALHQATR